MDPVVLITGNVNHRITLDPTLWIFDERRFQMEERFPGIDGLGIEFAPFLKNAQPSPDANKVIIHQRGGGKAVLTMEEAAGAVLQFAREGKPIRPDGPALLYLGDGSNRDEPVAFIERIEVV